MQERVGLIDVKATLVELAGLRAGASPQGRSLVPALRGEPLSTRPYFAAVAHGEAPPAEIQGKFYKPYDLGYDVAAYEGSLKILVGPGGITAFDVDADPGELAPLPQDRATKRWEELAARAIELRLKTDSAPLEADLTPEEKAGLRALGYFD